jgi:hemolysin III
MEKMTIARAERPYPTDVRPLASPASPVAAPLWRGLMHAWAFLLAALLTLVGVATVAPSARTAVAAYGIGMTLMFGVSALYHRGPRNLWIRSHLRRLDHTAIYAAIAGTYTPVCLLGIGGTEGRLVLLVVVLGALFGVACAWSPWSSLRRTNMVMYVIVGWASLPALPLLADRAGLGATALIVAGGATYTVGAVVLALRRPNPWPHVFGFHEVFHACTLVAASLQLVAITTAVLPAT